MVLPTGTISMANVNVELGLSSTTNISLNQTNVRSLAGIASGTISMNDLRGKSASAIATLTNHSADTYHVVYTGSTGEASAFTRLTVNSNGQLQLLGSTGWSSVYNSNGSYILIDGSDYWSSTLAGSTSGEVTVQNWLVGGGANLYSCRANIVSGPSPNGFTTFRYGTFGSWLAMTSSHDFAVQASGVGSNPDNAIDLVLQLQFARTDNLSSILGSCTITLNAHADYNEGVEP